MDCCGVHRFCVFILLCIRWQISGGWRRALYTHGGGGELSEGAAVHSLYKAICGQTGGRPVHFFFQTPMAIHLKKKTKARLT